MAGIIFFTTKNLGTIVDFYIAVLRCKIWLSQPDVEILSHGNLLLGFHQTQRVTGDTLTTFFYPSKERVDEMYKILKKLGLAKNSPEENFKYSIYNFFAEDPEGRKLEFQTFLHELPEITLDQ